MKINAVIAHKILFAIFTPFLLPRSSTEIHIFGHHAHIYYIILYEKIGFVNRKSGHKPIFL